MCTHDVPEQAIIFVTHMTPPELYVTSDALAYLKSLLNTLGRAVEQLAGCLAKAVKGKVQQPMPAQRVL